MERTKSESGGENELQCVYVWDATRLRRELYLYQTPRPRIGNDMTWSLARGTEIRKRGTLRERPIQ